MGNKFRILRVLWRGFGLGVRGRFWVCMVGLVWVVEFVEGGVGVGGCVGVYIYILPRSLEKIRFQTIDFLPTPCYNGSVKDKWGKEDSG